MARKHDNPEWTDADFKRAKRIGDLPPAMQSALRKVGRPKSEHPKRQITMRLAADIVEHLKSSESYMANVEGWLRQGIERGQL